MQSDNENINDLRALREEKKLTVSDVAGKLKLTSMVIERLEEGKFSELGAYTYVRGYLLHYADLLGVDAEKYISMIPKNDKELPLVNTHSNTSQKIKFKRQSKNVANYAVGTFIFLAICFSGWYLLKNYPGSENKLQDTVNTDSLEITPKSNSEESQNSGDTVNKQDDSYHYSSLIPAQDMNSANDKESQTVSDNEILIPQKEAANEDADKLISETTEQDSQPVEDYMYQIQISTTETSWVKVENMDGTKLHNDLLKPGFVSLQSNEKVHFRIGNKDNVTVVINGEEIDLTKYSRKNIADFNWPLDS